MTKRKRSLVAVLLVLLLTLTLSVSVEAASRGVYYRPAVTFVVENAPSDMILRIDFERNGEIVPVYLYMETRLWESYYRLYRQTAPSDFIWYGNRADFRNAVLVAITGGREIQIPLPEDSLEKLTMNDFYMLDAKDFTLRYGLPLWRTILLFSLRLVITLAAALLILYFFQYRWKKSWMTALVTNLLCQGALSLFVSNWINYNPKMIAVHFLLMLIILIFQIPIYWWLLDEDESKKSVIYALWSNVATAVLNLAFLIQCPL